MRWPAISAAMWQKLKNGLIYFALRALLAAAGLLPHRWALFLGGGLGAGFAACVPRERERAQRHLARAFPELPAPACAALARKVFVALGRNALEILWMFSRTTPELVACVEAAEGREHMQAVLARGRGVLCLAAHVGNWELLPIFTQAQGWPTAVVAQKLYDPRLDVLLNRFRERRGLRVLQRGNITGAIIRCLRANMLLGILNDQDTSVDSRWAPFFGRPAKTPVGMLRLARRTGAAVLPVFIARQANRRHRVYIQPELDLPRTGNEEADLAEGARLCNRAIEDFIRRFPDQWVWFHERWKSRTPADQAAAEGEETP